MRIKIHYKNEAVEILEVNKQDVGKVIERIYMGNSDKIYYIFIDGDK